MRISESQGSWVLLSCLHSSLFESGQKWVAVAWASSIKSCTVFNSYWGIRDTDRAYLSAPSLSQHFASGALSLAAWAAVSRQNLQSNASCIYFITLWYGYLSLSGLTLICKAWSPFGQVPSLAEWGFLLMISGIRLVLFPLHYSDASQGFCLPFIM